MQYVHSMYVCMYVFYVVCMYLFTKSCFFFLFRMIEVSVSAFESSAQIAQEEALMLEMEAKRLRDENMRLRAQVRTPLPYAGQEDAAAAAAWLFDSANNSNATLSFGSSQQVRICI